MPPEFVVFNAFHSIAGFSGVLDWLIIFLGKYLGYLLIFGTALFIIREKDWKKSFQNFTFIALSLILSRGLLTEILRLFIFRERPFAAFGFEPLINHSATANAFPSGHAVFYFTLAIALFYLDKKLGWYFLGGAVLIGLARVMAGVHWPLDIVGGAALGTLSPIVVRWLLVSLKRG